MAPLRQRILDTALTLFEENGYEATTIALVCKASGASNGSLFHHFGSKEGLAAALYMSSLRSYHSALLLAIDHSPSCEEGLEALLEAHLSWVVRHKAQARFLFEQSRAEWMGPIRVEQQEENELFAQAMEAWRQPLIASGQLLEMPALMFFSQLIGPAQLLSRTWLYSASGGSPSSSRSSDTPLDNLPVLIQCAIRALVVTSQA